MRSKRLVPGSIVVDMFTDAEVGEVDDLHSFNISLEPHQGLSLLVLCPGDHPLHSPPARGLTLGC